MAIRYSAPRWGGLIALIGLAAYGCAPAQGAGGGANRVTAKASTSGLLRSTLAKYFRRSKSLSQVQLKAMSDKLYSVRQQMAARVQPAASRSALPPVAAKETGPGAESRFHGSPSSLIVGKNLFNNRANNNT